MSHFGVPHTVNHAASGALRRNGKAAMSRIDRSKSRSAGGKGFYIALALCLAAVGAIGYFTLIRPFHKIVVKSMFRAVMRAQGFR